MIFVNRVTVVNVLYFNYAPGIFNDGSGIFIVFFFFMSHLPTSTFMLLVLSFFIRARCSMNNPLSINIPISAITDKYKISLSAEDHIPKLRGNPATAGKIIVMKKMVQENIMVI
jgi:hypothetical protein